MIDCFFLSKKDAGKWSCLNKIATESTCRWTALFVSSDSLSEGYNCMRRMAQVGDDTDSLAVYSNYYEINADGRRSNHPVNDCVMPLRDDFDFGPLMLVQTDWMRRILAETDRNLQHGAFYDLLLRMSEYGKITHIPEYLYSCREIDNRKSGEKQFDYVDPRNRDRQIELENVFTAYLKRIGAWLPPIFETYDDENQYDVVASVIIPVKNRQRTIGDAARSALSQATDFTFNVIVVDNHSDDGTSEVLREIAEADPRLVVITPDRDDLGIGGCWDSAINDNRCGRYAVQLDSDDLYSSNQTLQKIIDKFRSENCAAVIGSYTLTDFNLNTLPPGVIDHKEWTDSNGRNNALRINGLGAPRAFRTGLLREIGVPNTSYGEDYALGLAVSRRYRIGRIYDSIYLCRRWDGNSDAALSVEKVNANNAYKDALRQWEIAARQKINRERENRDD